MSGPIFYESMGTGLSTEVGYFEGGERIDFESLLRASETDRTRQAAVIREVVADRDAWVGRFRELEADRDAWVGYFKQLEADRDAWVARYEIIRSQIIAYGSDTPSRTILVRQLSAERNAAEVAPRERPE